MIAKFKKEFNQFLLKAKFELNRLITIGRHMFSASQHNAELNKTYLELGKLTAHELEAKSLIWQKAEATQMVEKIQELKNKLEAIEKEVQQVKVTSINSLFKK